MKGSIVGTYRVVSDYDGPLFRLTREDGAERDFYPAPGGNDVDLEELKEWLVDMEATCYPYNQVSH